MRDVLIFVAVHYWFWLLLGAMVAFFTAAIFITATIEKYYIRQFQPGRPEEAAPPSAYFLAMNEAAAKLGLRHCGDFVQSRGSSLYRSCLTLWLSSDQLTLVVVGGGKLARIDYKRTFFLSVTEDGREIITVDDFGLTDLSQIREIDVVYNANLMELEERHSQRLTVQSRPLKPFPPHRCLEVYEDLSKVRAEKLVSLGLARFLDPAESVWRYTFKGAWIVAYHAHFKNLQKAKLQMDRAKIKRPGS
jgi:hypothetical protein